MASFYMSALMSDLDLIVEADLNSPFFNDREEQYSLTYRLMIYIFYSHLRTLLAVTNADEDILHDAWDRRFRSAINSIHMKFGTVQTTPYHEWPTE